MFKVNTGLVDRIIRGVVGLALIAAYFIWPDLTYGWALWLGVIPLATAIFGWCPIYQLFGWSTHEDKDSGGKAHV